MSLALLAGPTDRFTHLGPANPQARLDTDRKLKGHIQAPGFAVTITKAA